MTKDQLLVKAKEVLEDRGLEQRFMFVQNDKNSYMMIDGKTIDEITIELDKGILWVGSSCIIQYKKLGYKTDEQALELYGGLLDTWIQAVTS
jgi:hypothetical protein